MRTKWDVIIAYGVGLFSGLAAGFTIASLVFK